MIEKETDMTEQEIQKLIDRAIVAREKTYSPYSHFGVGAALLCEDGAIYEGCNIENASYGLTNCAERTAIFKAVSEGRTNFKALAVVADTEGPCAPCGACRQVISEFDIPQIILANLKGNYKVISLDELLPFRFGADSLECRNNCTLIFIFNEFFDFRGMKSFHQFFDARIAFIAFKYSYDVYVRGIFRFDCQCIFTRVKTCI